MKISGVKLIDNSAAVLAAMHKQVQIGLQAVGAEAEGYAKDECPVDTGRLRNSITYAVTDYHSPSGGSPATGEDSATHATPEQSKLYIGSNVEYAPYVEFGDYQHTTGKKHFLKDAISNHSDHYKAIMKAALDT